MGNKQKLICTLIAAFLVIVVNGGVSADVILIALRSPPSYPTGLLWNPGKSYIIMWDITTDSGGAHIIPPEWVKVILYPQGLFKNATTIAEFPVSDVTTYFNWTVPPNAVPGSYVIRVQMKDTNWYPNKYGESAPFTIGPPAPAAVLEKPLPSAAAAKTETKGIIAIKNSPIPPGATAMPVPITPDLSGQWKSSIGLVYDITQKGDQFLWTVSKTNEKGQGILKGTSVSASWKGPQGSGSSQGQVTAIDATGRATRIDWKNGVQFYR